MEEEVPKEFLFPKTNPTYLK